MLQIMGDVPPHVVGVRALGIVTEEDYKTALVPALEKAAKEVGELNFLMIFENDLGNFSYGAWMQDAKVSLKLFGKWNRIAIVSDQTIVEKLAHIFNFISPAAAKGFPTSDIELATTWVAANEGLSQ